MALLQALAQTRGTTAAATMRQFVREEAGQLGLEVAPAPAQTGAGTDAEEAALVTDGRPIGLAETGGCVPGCRCQ